MVSTSNDGIMSEYLVKYAVADQTSVSALRSCSKRFISLSASKPAKI